MFVVCDVVGESHRLVVDKVCATQDAAIRYAERPDISGPRQVVVFVEAKPPPVGWALIPFRQKGAVELVAGYVPGIPRHEQTPDATPCEWHSASVLARKLGITAMQIHQAAKSGGIAAGIWRVESRPAPREFRKDCRQRNQYRARRDRKWRTAEQLAAIIHTTANSIHAAANGGYRVARKHYIEKRPATPEDTSSSYVKFMYRIAENYEL